MCDLLPAAERAWYDKLDPLIQIYRGCERGRERGLYWTTDQRVAHGFAIGQRCINDMPTVVRAFIPKPHVLALFVSREECEIVVDPRHLRRLEVVATPPQGSW